VNKRTKEEIDEQEKEFRFDERRDLIREGVESEKRNQDSE